MQVGGCGLRVEGIHTNVIATPTVGMYVSLSHVKENHTYFHCIAPSLSTCIDNRHSDNVNSSFTIERDPESSPFIHRHSSQVSVVAG